VSESQLFNETRIPGFVFRLQILEKATTLPNKLQETTTRVMVLLVGRKVPGKLVDARGKKSHLNLGGTCVAFFLREFLNDFSLFGLMKRHFFLLVSLSTAKSHGADVTTKVLSSGLAAESVVSFRYLEGEPFSLLW